MASAADRDSRHHTPKMQKALQEIRTHLREDIQKVDEPQLKAMFETSAEVLGGPEKGLQGLRTEERERVALIVQTTPNKDS
jgi:hypothetical protein